MSSTDKLVIPAYKQSSEREFNEWFRNLRTAAKQHKYLLDIIEVGTIRPGAEREAEAVALHVRYKNVGIADGLIPAKIDKFFATSSLTGGASPRSPSTSAAQTTTTSRRRASAPRTPSRWLTRPSRRTPRL